MTTKLAALALAIVALGCGASSATSPAATVAGGPNGSPAPNGTAPGAPGVPASASAFTPDATLGNVPAATVDSCSVLSDEEIQTGTGAGVVARKPSTLTQVFSSVCDIDLDNAASLTVSVLPSGGRDLYDTSFEPYIGEGDTAVLDEAVPGLGDKAARSGDDELMVLSGDTLFDVQYIQFGSSDKLPVVRYLAESVLAKLPCLAAGCPGYTPLPAPSRAASADVCALLTADEIKASTGFATSETSAGGGEGSDPNCTWTLKTDSPIPGSNYVEIELKSSGGRDRFDFLSSAYDPPLEHVAGLGDDAIKTGTIPDGDVYAVVGDRLITLSFSMPLEVDDPYALVVPLLSKALARL